MKTTTKLWVTGAVSGLVTFGILAFAGGYVLAVDPPSSARLILITAAALCLGFLSIGSCLSAVIVSVLQEDQRAATVLREVGQRMGENDPPNNLRVLRRDG